MASNEAARFVAIKNSLHATTSTPGWSYIKGMADNLVNKCIEEALEEEDREKRDGKTLKASALKKGFAELFNAIESAKSIDPEADYGMGFGQLEQGDRTDA